MKISHATNYLTVPPTVMSKGVWAGHQLSSIKHDGGSSTVMFSGWEFDKELMLFNIPSVPTNLTQMNVKIQNKCQKASPKKLKTVILRNRCLLSLLFLSFSQHCLSIL